MTSTRPAEGTALLAAIGLVPAVASLVWGGWIWIAMAAIVVVLLAWTRGRLAAPADLELRRQVDERLYLGVESPVRVIARNAGGAPVRVEVRDCPPQVLGDGELGPPVWIAPGEEHQFEYSVRPCDRGAHPFPEVWVRWWSPARMWRRHARYPVASTAAVYPDIRPLTDVSPLMLRKLYSELGIKEQRRRGSGTEFDHLKEHTPDDGTLGIDWKATARRSKPMVRTYRIEQNHDVLIGIDSGRLMGSRADGITKLDHAIHTSLLLSRVCLVNGDRPGLMTFDRRVHTYIKPSGDRGQMARVLNALHDLRSGFSETSFRRTLVYLNTHQRKRSLVVLLTDFVHGQADEQLVQSVVGLSRRHLVLFVALRDTFVQRLATSMPRGIDDVYSKVVAQGLEEDRRVVMQTLRSRGVHTLDQLPQQVTQPVLNRYLALRQGI